MVFDIPAGIDIAIDKQTHITVTGIDRQLVGQVAANIRRLRKPDPYKQKGVRYTGEVLKKKAGKTGEVVPKMQCPAELRARGRELDWYEDQDHEGSPHPHRAAAAQADRWHRRNGRGCACSAACRTSTRRSSTT